MLIPIESGAYAVLGTLIAEHRMRGLQYNMSKYKIYIEHIDMSKDIHEVQL